MKRDVMDLMCDLDESEVAERARQMGELIVEQDAVEDAKATQMKAFREQLAELRQRLRIMGRVIRTKRERRPVPVFIEFHTPSRGLRRVVREGTGELVREEPMTVEEEQEYAYLPVPEPRVEMAPQLTPAHPGKAGQHA